MADQSKPVSAAEDFEVAKVVSEALKDLPRARQERVLRWVTEGLGITSVSEHAAVSPPVVPPVPVSAPPTTTSSHHQAATDIASFVAEKKPRSDVQFVTVVAYYYRFTAPDAERRDQIDAQIARDATRLANWERLTSPIVTLHNAKKKGYLNSRGSGEFTISTVGENLVARTMPVSDEPASTSKRVAKRSVKKAKGAAKK